MKNFIYLNKDDIIESNFGVIKEYGGNYCASFQSFK